MNTILLPLFLAFIGWITFRNMAKAAKGDDLSILPKVDKEFQELIVDSEFPELCFDGCAAAIVDERREGTMDDGSGIFTLVTVHRFARNAHGEYFFFISEGVGKPFFKHVSHVNAKAALGKKYVAPIQMGG